MYYLYGSKPGIQRKPVATFDSERPVAGLRRMGDSLKRPQRCPASSNRGAHWPVAEAGKNRPHR